MMKKRTGFFKSFLLGSSLRKKLIVLCMCAMCIPMLAQVSIISQAFHTYYLDQFSSAMQESIDYGGSYLSSYLTSISSWCQGLSRDLGYLNLLSGRSSQEDAVRKRLDSNIQQFFHSHEEISSLAFWTSYDRLRTRISKSFSTYSYNWSTVEALTERFSFSYEELCQKGFLVNPAIDDRETFSVVWAIPNLGQKPLAIMINEIDFSAISSFFSVLDLEHNEMLCWLDDENRPLYTIGDENLLSKYLSAEGIFENETLDDLQPHFTIDNRKHIVFLSAPFFDGHRIARILPYDDFAAAADSFRNVSVFSILAAMAATFAVIIWGIRRLTRPFSQLGNAMHRLGEGNFSAQLESDGLDAELKPLIDQFNEMTQMINGLITEKYELTIEQQKAELRALEAQINPHFLYNTLQMLNSMALRHNAYEITTVVNSLGEMLRYCLKSGESSVTLTDEIENVKRYLTIQKLRFMNRLNFTICVDPELHSLPLPRMALQPLVENCIVHGMPDQSSVCSVLICARRLKDRVNIEIRNTGSAPIETERLRHLTEYLYDGTGKTSGHIGLKNCYLRLKYFYGSSLHFTLSSTQEDGTCVHIDIHDEGGLKA